MSPEQFSTAFRIVPLTMTIATAKTARMIDVNDNWVRLTGIRREDAIGRTPLELDLFEDPEDFHRRNRQLETEGVVRDVECRYRVRDGSLVIGLVSAAEFVADGEALRLTVVKDITAQRRAEDALSKVTQELLTVQEKERHRIANNLHDDIGQRLALVQIGIDQVQADIPATKVTVRTRLGDVLRQVNDIATEIRTLSHTLHSATLRLLTVEGALRGLCSDVGQALNLEIAFRGHDVSSPIEPDIAVCLFRVLQEALTNAAKHSGTARVDVELWGTPREIHLRITDFGRGFTPTTDIEGLGLITIRERVKMVHGMVSIMSPAGVGTTIDIQIPLPAAAVAIREELCASELDLL